jgi:hypothetical protein
MNEDMWCKSKSCSIGGILLAILIMAWGIIWLGNDSGWWSIKFPFWPVLAILIALGILLNEGRKGFR